MLAGNGVLPAAMAATGAFSLSAGLGGLFIAPLCTYVSNAVAIATMELLARRRVSTAMQRAPAEAAVRR